MENATTTSDGALLLKVPEVCKMLALGRSTVYVLMTEGELEVLHIGRSVRITAESTRAFVERRKSHDRFVPSH